MAVRTTSALVEGIIEVDSNISLTPFITAANTLVTKCCTDLTTDYTATELQQIETYLAAHFYTLRDPRAEREKAGSVEAKYQSKVALGFSTSHYGQTAMSLDYYGGLSNLNRKIIKGTAGRSFGVTWIGTESDD
jgi:hypothetical protein